MTIIDYIILPTIVYSQFAGTSLWFAPNAVISQLGFNQDEVANLVTCTQVGFIVGTATLTYFAVADRMSPVFLFTIMTIVGAVLNVICISTTQFAIWAVLRTLIGVALSGIYPVGMKIAAKEYPKGLGARLGVLVGALTLGTAFPWLVRGLGSSMPYQVTIVAVSILACSGAVLMYLVMIPRHGGPGSQFLKSFFKLNVLSNDNKNQSSPEEIQDGDADMDVSSANDKITHDTFHDDEQIRVEDLSDINIEADDQQLMGIKALRAIFADSKFKAAATGYFGHCFELYAFWTYVPTLIDSHAVVHGGVVLGNVALTSFTTIATGAVSCTLAGVWSLHAGRKRLSGSAVVAELNLLTSLVCCLLAPMYQQMSP